jgi:hypothetical protein
VIALIAVAIFFWFRHRSEHGPTNTVLSQPIGDVKQDPLVGSVPSSPPPVYPNFPVNHQNNFYSSMNQAQMGQHAPMTDAFGRPLAMQSVGSPTNVGIYPPPANTVSAVGASPPHGVSPIASPQPLQSNNPQAMELPGEQTVNNATHGAYHYPGPQGGAVEVPGSSVYNPSDT